MTQVLIVAPLALDDVTTPAGSYRDELGGSATYAALAARHFAPTAIAAVVGHDFPPELLTRLDGVDLSRVERVPGRSFRWVAEHDADGATRTLRNEPGARLSRDPALGDLSETFALVGALEPALQERVGQGARGCHTRSAKLIAIDTMPCYIDEDAPRLRRAMAGADLAFLTVEESKRLAGSREPERVRMTLGVDILVLKDGARGATVCDHNGSFDVPAYPVRVVDPTGAGDAFAGAFVATLCERGARDGDTLRLATRRGTAAASIAVEDFGPRALERAGSWLIERRADALGRVEVRS